MWHTIPPLQSLKLFDAVVRHGSMTRAATEAGISQSAVSQSILQLEDFVQVSLLDRSSRPMKLTEEGEIFHRVSTESLDRLSHHIAELRRKRKTGTNALTVSCNLGFATYWLMPRLNYFSADFPGISVNVMASSLGPNCAENDSDVSIRYGKGNWESDWQLLFNESIIPTCSPNYLKLHGQIETAKDLMNRRLIHVKVNHPDWMDWHDYFKHLNHNGAFISDSLQFGNYVQAVQSALAGDGIMLGWRSAVADLIQSEQLVIAFDQTFQLDTGYYLKNLGKNNGRDCNDKFLAWLKQQANETFSFDQ